jgi:hypothetical protein
MASALARVEVLIRFMRGCDPVRVGRTFVAAWRACSALPLFRLAARGALEPVTDALIERHLSMRPGAPDSSLRLCTSRSRKSAATAEFYFTNPDLAYSNPANYCAVEYAPDAPEAVERSLAVSILTRMLSAGPIAGAQAESRSVLDDWPQGGAGRELAVIGVQALHTLAFLAEPGPALAIPGIRTITETPAGARLAFGDTLPAETVPALAALEDANALWLALNQPASSPGRITMR